MQSSSKSQRQLSPRGIGQKELWACGRRGDPLPLAGRVLCPRVDLVPPRLHVGLKAVWTAKYTPLLLSRSMALVYSAAELRCPSRTPPSRERPTTPPHHRPGGATVNTALGPPSSPFPLSTAVDRPGTPRLRGLLCVARGPVSLNRMTLCAPTPAPAPAPTPATAPVSS